jgi:hypothetical protein
VLVICAVLVASVLLIAVVVVAVGDGGSDDAAAPAGPVDPPAGPVDPPAIPTGDAVEAVLPELQAFVEAARGVEFTEPVEVEVLDPDAYEQRTLDEFRAEIDEDRERLERAAAQYQALGLLDPAVDIVEALETYLSTGTAGFYDSETEELVVRGAELNADLRVTLVHELTHALDDQVFDLDRPELDDRDDEAGFAFAALIEGNATRIETEYVESLPPDEQLEYFRQAGEAAGELDLDAIPPVLLIEQEFVYGGGFAFVLALDDQGGNDAVDRAFTAPPLTSEAVLEPQTYLEDEGREEVPPPEADGEVVEQGVAGQFLLELLVNGRLGDDGVPEWVGDSYVVGGGGLGTCVRIAFVGDLDDLEDALSSWADRTGGRVVQADGAVTVTGCTR